MKNLSKHLKVFEPYIGKTYKGEFAESTPENPVFDVQYWERALNGNGAKITHSVNDGEYGGESIIMWDLKSKSLQSWYFTTAGFYTEATVTFKDKKVVSIEKVTGNFILRLNTFKRVNGLMDMRFIIKKTMKRKLYLNKFFPLVFWCGKHNNY